MNGELYRRARVLAGQWAAETDPAPHNLANGASAVPGSGPVVYIVADLMNEVAYVGSSMVGAAGRLRVHLANPYKRRTWRAVWLIPLSTATPESEVRRVEGRVGARLHPTGSRRLPKPFGPARSEN